MRTHRLRIILIPQPSSSYSQVYSISTGLNLGYPRESPEEVFVFYTMPVPGSHAPEIWINGYRVGARLQYFLKLPVLFCVSETEHHCELHEMESEILYSNLLGLSDLPLWQYSLQKPGQVTDSEISFHISKMAIRTLLACSLSWGPGNPISKLNVRITSK